MSEREAEQGSYEYPHLPESWVDERGVTLTRAGVEAFARMRAEIEARHDKEYYRALGERLGFSPRDEPCEE